MNRTVCQYAVLRFRPYAETGEFVNVGLAVAAPEAGGYAFRCDVNQGRRVGRFFPELEPIVFSAAIREMATELDRMERLLTTGFHNGVDPAEAAMTFRELIRPREGLLGFGAPGTLLAASVAEALETLFARYIGRQFAQPRDDDERRMQRDALAPTPEHAGL